MVVRTPFGLPNDYSDHFRSNKKRGRAAVGCDPQRWSPCTAGRGVAVARKGRLGGSKLGDGDAPEGAGGEGDPEDDLAAAVQDGAFPITFGYSNPFPSAGCRLGAVGWSALTPP